MFCWPAGAVLLLLAAACNDMQGAQVSMRVQAEVYNLRNIDMHLMISCLVAAPCLPWSESQNSPCMQAINHKADVQGMQLV